ncbi:hypothetical protein F1559_004635 [Cyanidiococcus yangmingshanensis]|uniref:Uncharacterized protein n=1 Tax=Cyanidiococcus yangmingshanensis TaxID=2690220 RepID=A0A7J7IKY4_9RHOD|nr:hypothetical protein F1559_004635 [Cyanidiococcus yangmingshanensis]
MSCAFIAMVYDAPRGRTRADLELSLAQKLAAYHPGDPAYDLNKFEASEPKRLGNNYVQRQLLGPRPFVMDGAFADIAGRGSNSRRASTAVAAAAAAAQTGLLRFPATVTGTDRQVDRESLRLAQLIPNLQFPAGIAAARALATEPDNIRSGVLHLPEPEGDILMGLHPVQSRGISLVRALWDGCINAFSQLVLAYLEVRPSLLSK